jgi:ATP synthase subunit 6
MTNIQFILTSPLEQFRIVDLISFGIGQYDLSLTNSSVSMLLVLFIVSTLVRYFNSTDKVRIIPSNWQLILESLYKFILSIITDQIGNEGKKYFTLLTTIFLFVLLSNFLGMIPYSFTVTSHPIVTLGFALSLFIGITTIGFLTHGLHFFHLFVPSGVPAILLPLIVIIEIISYLTRPISLGVRLAANMFAGHTLLNIISFFTWNIFIYGGILGILGILPAILILALISLEFVICFLQAYVFTVLVASYLNDVIHLH